jgi:hypothetical protein
LHGDVLADVVPGREAVVAGAGPEEPVVPLLAAGAPAVSGIVVQAPTERVGLVAELADVRRGHQLPCDVAVVDVDAAVDREVLSMGAAPRVEVVVIACQMAEVVVEGPVLHGEHDDRVDGAFRRRVVEDTVGRDLGVAEHRCV